MSGVLTQQELDAFTGDCERYRHPLSRTVIYTPGIKHLAERAGAYWLLDEIVLGLMSKQFEQTAMLNPRIGEMHFWALDVHEDDSATLTARADCDVPPFYSERITWTDFPMKQAHIWAAFDGRHWTLYLPSEH
jgi:hypothetical protein